ncbi:Hydrolase, alpha/beta fold family functionally coupled to Phosphoribulokinase [hydrothermal vent metagenome]|uniref:Hydrolase, alpha/beta fold family functionally coupled to Phosphoribulokinase n=1 Tax=hydrothermal vent metagenome TaxID=652676 RepID=A0A1W1CL27_9ZZZZ
MKFQPSLMLKNRHIQTVYASLFRKFPKLEIAIESFKLSDGDFVEAYWHILTNHTNTTPIVILFHGLAGSFTSPYIQGSMQALSQAGFSSVIMHFRGCSGKENHKARSYHSGDTKDALEFITAVKKRYPHTKLFAVGYSLGANMLLKLLGEEKEKILLDAAIAVSAPMLLDVCANRMNHGFSKFYQYILLKDLRIMLDKKYDKFDMQKLLGLKRKDINNLKNFWQFDEAYTAKINSFTSAQDYYQKSSAKAYLKNITIPTLIIHAKNDPFMTPEVIPNKEEISHSVALEILENGGHVGFISGTIFKPEYWLEKRVVDYFLKQSST